jgi:NAD+ kinase
VAGREKSFNMEAKMKRQIQNQMKKRSLGWAAAVILVLSFGCDGIVVSTPTGSTAYAFSAGGPVVWPSVDALLLVPLSAHALFARPQVISPGSLLAVEVLRRSPGHGVLWCDGRRTTDLPAGARVEVRKSDKSVKLARLNQGPFTNRLVKKFSLPVEGWRGPDSKKD